MRALVLVALAACMPHHDGYPAGSHVPWDHAIVVDDAPIRGRVSYVERHRAAWFVTRTAVDQIEVELSSNTRLDDLSVEILDTFGGVRGKARGHGKRIELSAGGFAHGPPRVHVYTRDKQTSVDFTLVVATRPVRRTGLPDGCVGGETPVSGPEFRPMELPIPPCIVDALPAIPLP